MSLVLARPVGDQPSPLRWEDLLLGPPLATSRLVRERLRKVVALGDRGRFGRLLHDQTGRNLLAARNRLAGGNVAVVHPMGP